MEPQFIAQTADVSGADDAFRRQWIKDRIKDARDYGMTWPRVSWKHEGSKLIILFEAWKTRPDDEGDPRFGVAA